MTGRVLFGHVLSRNKKSALMKIWQCCIDAHRVHNMIYSLQIGMMLVVTVVKYEITVVLIQLIILRMIMLMISIIHTFAIFHSPIVINTMITSNPKIMSMIIENQRVMTMNTTYTIYLIHISDQILRYQTLLFKDDNSEVFQTL